MGKGRLNRLPVNQQLYLNGLTLRINFPRATELDDQRRGCGAALTLVRSSARNREGQKGSVWSELTSHSELLAPE